jgi:hypothetical protein
MTDLTPPPITREQFRELQRVIARAAVDRLFEEGIFEREAAPDRAAPESSTAQHQRRTNATPKSAPAQRSP